MVFPITYTLKMDVSGTAFGGSPTWTDFTAYMLPFKAAGHVADGRQDESSDVNPGQFTFTLDNRDSRFTPGHAASPYYPHIQAGVRVRLEIVCNATTTEYFDGYADSFDAYLAEDRAFGLCDVVCTDVLGRLGRTAPLRSVLIEETKAANPNLYVPMTDTTTVYSAVSIARALIGPATGASIGAQSTTSTLGGYTFGGSGPPGDTTGALTIVDYLPSDGFVYSAGYALGFEPTLGATAVSAGVWFRNPVKVTGRPLVFVTDNNETLGVDISLPASSLTVKAFVGSTKSTGTSGSFHVGSWHLIGVQVTATGSGPYTVTANVYIDGTLLETTSASLTSNKIQYIQIGGQLVSAVSTTLIPGDYAHFAVWNAAAPTWSTLYSAGHSGFSGEATTTHLSRLLGYRAPGISTVTSGVYSGTVGTHETDSESVLQAMFDTAHVEAAPLYADGQGRIVLLNRGQMTSPSVAVTLDGTDRDIRPTLRVRSDNEYIVNYYEVTPSSGNLQYAQDATSQGSFGYYSGSLSAPFSSDSDAHTVAAQVITSLKNPSLGASSLEVNLFALAKHNAALVASLLAVRTGGVVALTNLPAPFDALNVMVQGRELEFTTESAVLTLHTSGLGVGVAPAPSGAA